MRTIDSRLDEWGVFSSRYSDLISWLDRLEDELRTVSGSDVERLLARLTRVRRSIGLRSL